MTTNPIAVYVPNPDATPRFALAVSGIDRGSGIVGSPIDAWRSRGASHDPDSDLIIHYEGNRYGYANVHTFADRVRIAAGRHVEHAPTTAMQSAPREALIRVGSYWPDRGRIELAGREVEAALQAWLGVSGEDLAHELQCTEVRT